MDRGLWEIIQVNTKKSKQEVLGTTLIHRTWVQNKVASTEGSQGGQSRRGPHVDEKSLPETTFCLNTTLEAPSRSVPAFLFVNMVGPTASLSQLNRADGSASYKCPATGYNILGAVNAPIELPARRDALKPEEATVEVFVKPGTTTAGVGERYVEGILRSVLGKVVLGREKGFPRRGVVLTLGIVGGENVQRGDSVSVSALS